MRLKARLLNLLGKGMDGHTRRMALRGSLGNGLLQVISILLLLATQLLIARLGGKEAYGAYTLVFTWIGVLLLFGNMGTGYLLMKEIPAHAHRKDGAGIRDLFFWTGRTVTLASLCITVLFALLVNYGHIPGVSNNAAYFNAALPIIFLGAAILQLQHYLMGLQQVVLGNSAERIIKPVGLLLAILALWYWGRQQDPMSYIRAGVASFTLAFLYAAALVWRQRHKMAAGCPIFLRNKAWARRSVHLVSASMLFIISVRMDILVVGGYMGNVASGQYNVALKYADMAMLPFVVVSHSIAPLYSKLQSQGKREELQSLFRNGTRGVFAATTLIFISFLLLGRWIIGWFGEGYGVSYAPLIILGAARLFSAFIGPVGMLLIMLGSEKANNLCFVLQIAVMATGLYFLMPAWGLNGVAASTALGIVTFQSAAALQLYRRHGIRAGVF